MDDLWPKARVALERGNFSQLENILGGPEGFDTQIIDWKERGFFDSEPEALAEVFTCACMLGRIDITRNLLDKGVDPIAGIKTGLNGFHYAVSGGHLEIVKLLIERKVPIEIDNMYGGTVFGQSLWSAVNEYKASHAAIIEALIDADAEIEPGTLEWWEKQNVPSAEAKTRVAKALGKALPAG